MTDKMDLGERRRICTQVLNMPAVERLESQDEFFNFEELESFLLHVVERKPVYSDYFPEQYRGLAGLDRQRIGH